jgi:hypothetical protein
MSTVNQAGHAAMTAEGTGRRLRSPLGALVFGSLLLALLIADVALEPVHVSLWLPPPEEKQASLGSAGPASM